MQSNIDRSWVANKFQSEHSKLLDGFSVGNELYCFVSTSDFLDKLYLLHRLIKDIGIVKLPTMNLHHVDALELFIATKNWQVPKISTSKFLASTKLILYQTYVEIQTTEIFYNTWHTFEFYMLTGDFNFCPDIIVKTLKLPSFIIS